MHKKKILFLAVFAVLIILALVFRGPLSDQENLRRIIGNLGIWGPIILILVLILHGVISLFPAAVLMFLAGTYYGFLRGAGYSLIGMTIGAILAFFISKKYGRDIERAWLSRKKVKSLNHLFKKWGAYMTFFGRLSLIFPSDTISFASGIARMRFRKFLVATIAGLIPAVLLVTYFGAKVTRGILNTRTLAVIVFILLVLLVLRRLNHKIAHFFSKRLVI